jgi:SAM-dependent methyltransferase
VSDRGQAHPFTGVDAQSDPRAWIRVLDALRREPGYAAYKMRAVELLAAAPGEKYLEVGTGTGDDALAFARRFGVDVIGIDASNTMIEEARRRGLRDAVVADAMHLPFDAGAFDGSWADRTFQHLARPEVALAEMVRVTRTGGRIVIADPDYDTQVVDILDQELARRVLRYRADHMLTNGALAHQMGRLFLQAGLTDIHTEAMPIVLRDPRALDHAMGLRSWADTACARGFLENADVHRWEQMLDDAETQGYFLYAFTVYVTVGVKR